MEIKTIAFFNNKGGVGKTTMVYHIAWMLSELGYKVVTLDLDPQSNLTSMFLSVERLEEVLEKEPNKTVLGSIIPVTEGVGYSHVHVEKINENIGHVIGDLTLSAYEDRLSDAWLKCLSGDTYAFRITSIFNTIIKDASDQCGTNIVLIDVGPNLGAINRAVMISSDFIIMPVASDLFSLQGIKNLGSTLKYWKDEWNQRMYKNPKPDTLVIPNSETQPAGYIILQYSAKERRPVKAYFKWANRIPEIYNEYVLSNKSHDNIEQVENDPNCLGLLKHYHSLAPMSMEAHKPMFLLKPADGAIGAHVQAVQKCYSDFKQLTESIMKACKR